MRGSSSDGATEAPTVEEALATMEEAATPESAQSEGTAAAGRAATGGTQVMSLQMQYRRIQATDQDILMTT